MLHLHNFFPVDFITVRPSDYTNVTKKFSQLTNPSSTLHGLRRITEFQTEWQTVIWFTYMCLACLLWTNVDRRQADQFSIVGLCRFEIIRDSLCWIYPLFLCIPLPGKSTIYCKVVTLLQSDLILEGIHSPVFGLSNCCHERLLSNVL